jgi:hypothetical protein
MAKAGVSLETNVSIVQDHTSVTNLYRCRLVIYKKQILFSEPSIAVL